MPHTIWYTRCPVATASGIAYQRNMFSELFARSGYEVRNLKELGKEKTTTHLTHTMAESCREGGALPPITARQSGADTALVGFTYVAETLSFDVRADSDIQVFNDLRVHGCAFQYGLTLLRTISAITPTRHRSTRSKPTA